MSLPRSDITPQALIEEAAECLARAPLDVSAKVELAQRARELLAEADRLVRMGTEADRNH
jgi:hypothetical protein